MIRYTPWLLDSIRTRRERSHRHAQTVMPTIEALRAEGLTYARIARALNEQGLLTCHKRAWTNQSVRYVGRKHAGLS